MLEASDTLNTPVPTTQLWAGSLLMNVVTTPKSEAYDGILLFPWRDCWRY